MTFGDYVANWESLYLAMGGGSQAPAAAVSSLLPWTPRRILLVAPHPDDECLMAGAALRLRDEVGALVQVVPYSYGSDPGRRTARKSELARALAVLGFELLDPRGLGDGELTEDDLERALSQSHPDAVLCPHELDGHPTHIRCSLRTRSALRRHVGRSGAPVLLLETEYWHPNSQANLRVPLSLETVTRMGQGLMEHGEEVRRNPYHLSLPAWLMDQERRGSELISGPGNRVADPSLFSQLYRMSILSPQDGS